MSEVPLYLKCRTYVRRDGPASGRVAQSKRCITGHHPPCAPPQASPTKASVATYGYRGTSLIRNCAPLGPYSRNMPRALWWSWGGGLFLISEVPL